MPALSAEAAAALYQAMLLDILDQHAECGAALALWHTPPGAAAWFRERAPARYRLYAQEGPDLAGRMARLFETHAAEGFDRIVLRGTDSPTLPHDRVAGAFAALERVDLALCPDRDGGYNAIGLRAPCASLFALEMSTASVLEQTLARARQAGLREEVLEPHYDVDTVEDLARLVTDVTPERTSRTLAWLRETGRAGPRDKLEDV